MTIFLFVVGFFHSFFPLLLVAHRIESFRCAPVTSRSLSEISTKETNERLLCTMISQEITDWIKWTLCSWMCPTLFCVAKFLRFALFRFVLERFWGYILIQQNRNSRKSGGICNFFFGVSRVSFLWNEIAESYCRSPPVVPFWSSRG